MVASENKIQFIIRERVKNTRKILKPTIINCVSSDIVELDVALLVKHYIERTKTLRGSSDEFFISWVTKKPVSKQTLARWLKSVLDLAGIDTSIFKAHSYRGASLSHALQKGASIDDIIKAGNWSNANTFLKYYNAPQRGSDIGNLIIEN